MIKVLVHFSTLLWVVPFTNLQYLPDHDLPLILIEDNNGKLETPKKVEWLETEVVGVRATKFRSDSSTAQQFYCSAETDDQRKKIKQAEQINSHEKNFTLEKVDQDCLFKKNGSKEMPIPFCINQPQPKLMKAGERCGPLNIEEKLVFGYAVCQEFGAMHEAGHYLQRKVLNRKAFPFKSVQRIDIYELCYDNKINEVMYSSHAILTVGVLFSYMMKKETQKTVEMATHNSIHTKIDFKAVKKAYEKVVKSDTNPKYQIQLLTSLEEYPFVLWKKAVNHYANANLIHAELQQCWNKIHEFVRGRALAELHYKNDLRYFTGAFKLKSTGNVKIIEKVEIPKIWVELTYAIYENGQKVAGVAIVANNYRDDDVDEIITETYRCRENLCANYMKYECLTLNGSHHIRCCPVTQEIKKLFGVKLEFENTQFFDNSYNLDTDTRYFP